MRIGIEATLAQGMKTGFGHYVFKLLEAFAKRDDGNEYILLHSTPEWNGPDFGKRFKPVSYHFGKQSAAIAFSLNGVLKKSKADIFHATCTTGVPPRCVVPSVATIHDIYPLLDKRMLLGPRSLFFRFLMKWTVRYADFFITNSEFTLDEFTRYYHLDRTKAEVIRLAPCVENPFSETGNNGKNFVLNVGAIENRKGQLLLATAYMKALKELPELPDLYFVGPDRGDGNRLASIIRDARGKIVWYPYLNDGELKELYKSAAAFFFPSSYEGFGFPVLEAMTYLLPVFCGDIKVLREICGNYPVFIPAKDEEAWKNSFLEYFRKGVSLPSDKALAQEVLSRYSWDNCAAKTLNVYRMLKGFSKRN